MNNPSLIFKKRTPYRQSFFYIMLLVLLAAGKVEAQPNRDYGFAYPQIFTFYNSSDAAMPIGSDLVSKSIIFFDNSNRSRSQGGTASLIRTFRKDNKVCMCLTGHQITAYYPNGGTPVVPTTVVFNSDIYMDYTGTIDPADRFIIDTYKRGFLLKGNLVAYFDESRNVNGTGVDIALVTIDRSVLVNREYFEQPYNFAGGISIGSVNYFIGHPNGNPQTISDFLTTTRTENSFFVGRLRLPFATAGGASGSPVNNRPGSAADPRYMLGVLNGAKEDSMRIYGAQIRYGIDNVKVTRLSVIADAIKEHCWPQNKDSMERTGSYKQGLLVDNAINIAPYGQNRAIGSAASLTASAGSVTESSGQVKFTHLKGNVITLGNCTLPAVYPGSSDAWQIAIVGKEIILSEFSHAASGDGELNLAGAVVDEVSSAASLASRSAASIATDQITTEKTAIPAVTPISTYPNPSSNGIFIVNLGKADQAYRVEVCNTMGSPVYRGETTLGRSTYKLNLGSFAKGAYFITVYNKLTGKKTFNQVLVYQ